MGARWLVALLLLAACGTADSRTPTPEPKPGPNDPARPATVQECDDACANVVAIGVRALEAKIAADDNLAAGGEETRKLMLEQGRASLQEVADACRRECIDNSTMGRARCFARARTSDDFALCK